jgi:hypothetical protein
MVAWQAVNHGHGHPVIAGMKRAFAATAHRGAEIALASVLIGALAVVSEASQNPRPVNRGQAIDQPRAAQPPRGALRADLAAPYDGNVEETRRRLQEVLQQYPPSLREVLRLDPSLLGNPAYLEPYPALAEFLSQHDDIAHNPGFFFPDYREFRGDRNDPKLMTIRTVEESLAGLAVLIGFLTVVGTIAWLLRTVIEHRRWLRVSKIHTDTHTKLLDRLTSNEDLLAYMQSSAGRRFLEAAPLPLGAGPRSLAAPVGRILWSVQAGCVIAFAGAGLMYASSRFAANATFADIELPFLVMGVTAVAIGAGFVASAVIAYVLSRRLGLLASPAGSSGNDLETESVRHS